MTWQQRSEDDWVFGTMLRGVVRDVKAFTYYDEDCDSSEGGWRCCVHVYDVKGQPIRSIQPSFLHAVRWCEEQLGIKQ